MNPAGAIAAASVRLAAPPDYWTASPEDRANACNGCGTKGLPGRLVPDRLLGLPIGPCCDIHDWMYLYSRPRIEDKHMADRVFLENMLAVIRADKKSSAFIAGCRSMLAAVYYAAVVLGGNRAFWATKKSTTVSNEVLI